MAEWCDHYPIVSIEDPMADTDWEGWRRIMENLADRIQIVGDDLFTTNVQRIRKGIEEKVGQCRADQAEPNWHGDGNLEAIRLTQQAGWQPVVQCALRRN